MQQQSRNLWILLGAVAVAAGILSQGFFAEQFRLVLATLPAASQSATTALGVEQGLPSYSGYPSPTNCSTGESLCYPNTRITMVSVRDQGGASGAGETKYMDLAGVAGSSGTPVVLATLNPTTIQWSCQPSQVVTSPYYQSQTCSSTYDCSCWLDSYGGVFCSTCTSYYECGYWTTQTNTYTMSAGSTGSGGAFTAGGLSGSQTLTYPVGTYETGEVVPYTLSCNYGTPVSINVTMGSTITTTSLSASATTLRAGLDQTTLTVTATDAVADSCQLLGNAGVIKSYTGTSVSDIIDVGPFNNESESQTVRIRCITPEGFSKTSSVTLTIKIPPALSITANNLPTVAFVAPNTSADIRWTSSNQYPNSCSVSYTAYGGSCAAAAKYVATKGAYAWKAFTVDGDTFLAVANAYDGTTYNTDSSIYKWVSSLSCFGKDAESPCGTSYQDIATNGASMWESFTVSGDTYLAVANSRNDTTRLVNSNIYKWLSAQACFGADTTCGTAYQSIPTSGAVDLQPITVGSTLYLAAANYRDDTTYATSSTLYRWMSSGTNCPSGGGFGNGAACGSVLQSIATKGAYRMEAFVVEGESYLAVSNAYDGSGYNLPSHIYKYTATGTNCPSGGGFGNGNTHTCGTPIQTINTSGAYGFKFFMVGSAPYLAVANSYDGTTFQINSKIYKWMSGSKCFGSGTTCSAAFQVLATKGATQLQTFTIGPETYLLAANAYDGLTYNISSSMYRWMQSSQCFGNSTSCGTALEVIPTSGAAWWEPVTVNGDVYLATANYFNGTTRNINSAIMKWSPNGCGDTEFGTPATWTADQSPVAGYPTGVFSGARLYTLVCKWMDNTTASSTSVIVSVLPELILSANGSTTNPVYVTPGSAALIQWSAKNVQNGSCGVTNTYDASNWAGDNNSAGYSSPVFSNGQEITYTLACLGLDGAPLTKVMRVIGATPVPLLSSLSISASRVVKGGRPTIHWNATDLDAGIECSVTPTLQGGASASTWDGSGTTWSSPVGGAIGPIITVATAFTLKCVNAAGDIAQVSAVANLIPGFKEI